MPTNVTGDATGGSFPANVVAPSDGDLAAAASAQTPFEDLADRTHWLYRNPAFAIQNWREVIGVTDGLPGPITLRAVGCGPYSVADPIPAAVIVGDYISGANVSAVFTTDGGKTWFSCASAAASGRNVYDIAWLPGLEKWMMVGQSGYVSHSSTIYSGWTEETGPASFYALGTDRVGLAVMGGLSTMWSTSNAGVTITACTGTFPALGDSVTKIAYGNGSWVATSLSTAPAVLFGRSTNGYAWVPATTAPTPVGNVTGITWTGEQFLMVDDDGDMYSSENGEYWVQVTHGLTLSSFLSIASDTRGSGAVLVGCGAASNYAYAASMDHGFSWKWIGQPPSTLASPNVAAFSDVGGYWVTAGTGTNFSAAFSLSVGI